MAPTDHINHIRVKSEEDHPYFGISTFFARLHPGETCGSNGLPLTPNSITILGRAQQLKTLNHPNLCTYFDIVRGKHERIVVVSEWHEQSLASVNFDNAQVEEVASQTLSALVYLNQFDITIRNLTIENILLNSQGIVRLYNFGLYNMTGGGSDVAFPIGEAKYLAPEVIAAGPRSNVIWPKADVWSLGVILTEAALGKRLWLDLPPSVVLQKLLTLIRGTSELTQPLEFFINELNATESARNLDPQLRDFIELCLTKSPLKRPTPESLLQHPSVVRGANSLKHLLSAPIPEPTELVLTRPVQELYYLWQLAGGDVIGELRKQGMVRSRPPVLSLPRLVTLEGHAFGVSRDRATLLDRRVVPVTLKGLFDRLRPLPPTTFYPTIDEAARSHLKNQQDNSLLPLVIRERDIEYQLQRIVMCRRLIDGQPYLRAEMTLSASVDAPPLYRAAIWASLLRVTIGGGLPDLVYQALDKDTPTHTDRQIEVDIPRCHQYDELLSSSAGHRKLKRVLKAWVVAHPQYVYWQGLDSLCAPFLYLNFNAEACAYACLAAFIDKYLHCVFLKDNSAVIREYLAKFLHLIAYHDPELASHLDTIQFHPELFAIPWFLTMFSHVLPIYKIVHLWDKLLLGDASFPLHVGLAVVAQLRDTLLASGFNECILLFSDLPELDMATVVRASTDTYRNTPRSITYREYQSDDGSSSALDPPVSLADLQAELCPRISVGDMMSLHKEDRCLVIDVRISDDFARGTVPGSINMPYSTIDETTTVLPPIPEGDVIRMAVENNKVIVVLGPRGPHAALFARWLIHCHVLRVSVLHQGIASLRHTNLLVVP